MESKKDLNVELIRILACLIVIGTHCKLENVIEGVPQTGRIFISCLLGDGVALFWMITGFFIFSQSSYKKRTKKLVINIILPSLGIVFLSQILGAWIWEGASLKSCFEEIRFDWQGIISNILIWSAGMRGCEHLWYIFTYVQNFLWVPLLALVCVPNEHATKVRRYLIVLGLLSVCINDIQNIIKLPVGTVVPYSVISASLMQMLIGYELYQNVRKLVENANKKMIGIISSILFVFINCMRCFFQERMYWIDSQNSGAIFWATGWGTMSAIFLIIAVFSINVVSLNKVKGCITKIGGATFGIYLIHLAVLGKFSALGFQNWLLSSLGLEEWGNKGMFLYVFLLAITIFFVSLIIILGIKYLKNMLVLMCRKNTV